MDPTCVFVKHQLHRVECGVFFGMIARALSTHTQLVGVFERVSLCFAHRRSLHNTHCPSGGLISPRWVCAGPLSVSEGLRVTLE